MAAMERTSMQLPREVVKHLDSYPGISRSEAMRMELEIVDYLLFRDMEHIAQFVDEHSDILEDALQGLSYGQWKIAARALPALLSGVLDDTLGGLRSDAHERVEELLSEMPAAARIGVLFEFLHQKERRWSASGKMGTATKEEEAEFLGATSVQGSDDSEEPDSGSVEDLPEQNDEILGL